MAERISKSARTRQRILDAAAKVFRQQGYAGARLSDIADLAGMQTGSLYYHFASREELVAEILHLGIEKAWAHVTDAVDSLPECASATERLATAIRAHTMAVLQLSDYTTAQARIVGQVPPEIAKVHRSEQRKYGEFWHTFFVAVRDDGLIAPDADLVTMRLLAFGAMNWTSEWFNPKRGPSAAAVAEQTIALVMHGVLAPLAAVAPKAAAKQRATAPRATAPRRAKA